MQRILSLVQALALGLAGLGGVILAVLGFFNVTMPSGVSFQSCILGLLGMLAIALGIERAVEGQRRDAQLQDILKAVNDGRNAPGVRFLRGHDEIFQVATQIVGKARRRVRTTITSGRDPAPKEFVDTLVATLRESGKRKDPVHNDNVISLRSPDSVAWEEGLFERRLELFRANGIARQVKMYLSNTPTMFDVVIVDEDHVVVAFSVENQEQLQYGYAFLGQPEIAHEMACWFDKVLLPHARKMEAKEPTLPIPPVIELPRGHKGP